MEQQLIEKAMNKKCLSEFLKSLDNVEKIFLFKRFFHNTIESDKFIIELSELLIKGFSTRKSVNLMAGHIQRVVLETN